MIKRIKAVSIMILGLIGLFSLACPDTRPPTIIITQPTDNTTVSGNVEIIVTATDNVGVTKVEFYVDGSLEGTDNTAVGSEYSYIWDASNEPPGSSHTIQAKAYDAAGNVGESSIVTIEIEEAAGPGTEHCGTISVDETWFARDNPHIVTCDIDVKAILTIEPGVIVKFHVGTNINVGFTDPGAIIANGTTSSPITFTSNVSYPSPGDWDGLILGDETKDEVTVLNYCLVEYAGGGSHGANVYCSKANPTITNCTVRHSSGYGVNAYEGGFTQFTGNTITQNGLYPVYVYGEFVRTLGLYNILKGNIYDGIVVHGDNIKTTGTWLRHDVPYIIEDRLIISGTENPVITIAPNSVLRFKPGSYLQVGNSEPGALIADGSSGQITFTASTSDPSPGDWKGIYFADESMDAVTILNNCLIEYAGGGTNEANIYCSKANPTITNCTIRHSSGYGVNAYEGGFTQFTDNTITQNGLYPVYVYGEFVRTLGPNNTLTGNSNDGILVHGDDIKTTGTWLDHGIPYIIEDRLIISETPNPTITIAPNSILKFKPDSYLQVGGSSPGALIADGSTGQITFTASTSVPSPDNWKGIYFADESMDEVTILNHCLIEYAGGGTNEANIYCSKANPTITNCTIRYSSGYGVNAYEGGFTQFTDNTITDNGLYPLYIYGEFVRTLGPNNTMTGNTIDGILVHGDKIKTTGTWLNHGIPYVIAHGGLDIGGNTNPVITIKPYSTLKFEPDNYIKVGSSSPGGLIADGSSGQITFTASTSPPSPGTWWGINFYDESMDEMSILNNCLVEYGGLDANITCVKANPTITNCTIRHSYSYGVYAFESGFTQFSGNTITQNDSFPVYIYGEYVRTLGPNNTLTGNSYDGIEVHGDDIKTTGTWLNHGVPYIIAHGGLDIGGTANPVITITANSTLKFEPDNFIKVGSSGPGGLIADGSLGQITFTSNTSPPSPGDWWAINLYDESIDGMTILINCLVEYGGTTANIKCARVSPIITFCQINHSECYGIYIGVGSSPIMSDNSFTDNFCGDVYYQE